MTRKIAILGGGAASLFAAWELMKSGAGHDITVYQVGWRLGGKGASGRRIGDERIEEHGLHLMFGFYQNVFRVVRGAYADAYGDAERWKRFFRSEDTSVAMIKYKDIARTRWEPWLVPYPVDDTGGLPGDPGVDPDVSVLRILRNMWNWLRALAKEAHSGGIHSLDDLTARVPSPAQSLDELRQTIDSLRASPAHAPLELLSELKLASRLDVARALFPNYWETAKLFLDKLETAALELADPTRYDWLLDRALDLISVRLPPGLGSMLVFVKAVARGVFIDLFAKKTSNWFALDEWDFAEWIERHGGDPAAPQVEGLYDAVFAFYSKLGAGAILQAAMKAAFLFRGAAVWKMQAGMGDAIFSPLYLALVAGGVKFEFFHRVEELTPNAGADAVETIVFDRQVDPAALPAAGYYPLRPVQGDLGGPLSVDCWPSEPLWDQIAEPERTRVKAGPNLENSFTPPCDPARRYVMRRVDGVAGPDEFNDVILGISVAALRELCPDLLARDPRFDAHVDLLAKATTATQAMQLWTVPGQHPAQPAPIIVPNGTPYDTIADMSHLLAAEHHPPGAVHGIFYLCSALVEADVPGGRTEPGYPAHLLARATRNADEWLATRAPILWPSLNTPEGFQWNALYDPRGRTGRARLAAQYVNTPINLSDRYVLSPPMTVNYRLQSNETRYRNLFLTGDWIKTALSIGCLEATAMSGIQAARALSRERGGPLVPRAHGDWIDESPDRVAPAARVVAPIAPAPAARAASPAYVQRDSELIVSPPYEISGETYVLVLPANLAALQRVCDRELNLDPRLRYKPLGPYVVLYAAKLTNSSLGTTCASTEAGFWMPVECAADNGLRTYSPYVWIDSPTSALGGRLVFGYTKQVAEVVLPGGTNPSIVVSGDAAVRNTPRGPWRIERSRLLTASPSRTFRPPDPLDGLMSYYDIARLLADSIGLDPLRIVQLFGGMRSVFLKQTPDVSVAAAAYQAIVEGTITPAFDTIRGKPITGPWSVELAGYDRPNIVDVLGLDVTTIRDPDHGRRSSRVESIAQAWLRFGARVDAGAVIWPPP